MSYINGNLSPLEEIEYTPELKELSYRYPQIVEWAEAYEDLDEIRQSAAPLQAVRKV